MSSYVWNNMCPCSREGDWKEADQTGSPNWDLPAPRGLISWVDLSSSIAAAMTDIKYCNFRESMLSTLSNSYYIYSIYGFDSEVTHGAADYWAITSELWLPLSLVGQLSASCSFFSGARSDLTWMRDWNWGGHPSLHLYPELDLTENPRNETCP